MTCIEERFARVHVILHDWILWMHINCLIKCLKEIFVAFLLGITWFFTLGDSIVHCDSLCIIES
jgi:hypothetical protein